MNIQLAWCPCIDDQTRRDFAHHVAQDIQKKYSLDIPLTLISLGSGALKQEELIAQLLLNIGYTHITLVLIDMLYKQEALLSLEELEKHVTLFESTPDFEKLGDLYISLEHTDDSQEIKKIEQEIDALEKKIKIEQYVELCDQQTALLHQERMRLLQESLTQHAPHATITINDYPSVATYMQAPKPFAPCVLFIDPDTRAQYSELQNQAFSVLKETLKAKNNIYILTKDI